MHGAPGASFECWIVSLCAVTGPIRDFHLGPVAHNSTSCSGRKVTQKNTQKELNGEKKSVYSARHFLMSKQCYVFCPAEASDCVLYLKLTMKTSASLLLKVFELLWDPTHYAHTDTPVHPPDAHTLTQPTHPPHPWCCADFKDLMHGS